MEYCSHWLVICQSKKAHHHINLYMQLARRFCDGSISDRDGLLNLSEMLKAMLSVSVKMSSKGNHGDYNTCTNCSAYMQSIHVKTFMYIAFIHVTVNSHFLATIKASG